MSQPLDDLKIALIGRTLKSCRLFTSLGESDVSEVASIVSMHRFDAEGYVFREGQPSKGFYVVQKGAISVHRVSASGKEQVLHVFRPGDSFAEATLSMERGYPADAKAIEASQVLLIPRDGFLNLLRAKPELSLRLLVGMSLRLRTLVGQLEDLTFHQVEDRLAHWLLKRCPDPAGETPVSIELTTTKRALAAELGTVSETLSRTLAKLREQKLLKGSGRTLTVESPSRLQEFLRQRTK